MGKIIIETKNGKLESMKCKSKERAVQISAKRTDIRKWTFYEDNQRIPVRRKNNIQKPMPTSFEELERMMKGQGLL